MSVYFIRCGSYVKIGRARSVRERLRALQSASPLEMAVVLVIKSDIDQDSLRERLLHEFFADERHRGEWFETSARIARFVRLMRARAGDGVDVDAVLRQADAEARSGRTFDKLIRVVA